MNDDKIILNESETDFTFKLNNFNPNYNPITANNKYIARMAIKYIFLIRIK